MSTEAERGGHAARLWGSGREKERQAEEKVLPLKPPAELLQSIQQDDRVYVPFELRERAERLHIVRGAGPSRFPGYTYLLDISFDHHLHSAFVLIYTFMVVEVTGSNLGPIVHAISFGNCERIREYHPKLHASPAEGEPLIEKIQITAADEKLT